MISLDPKRYMGKCSLVIRTWDGIDQPDYYPVFDITEEEMELNAGRFSKYMKRVADVEQILFLPIISPKDELLKIIPWIVEYVNGNWAISIERFYLVDAWKFFFTNANDAVLFKLTWNAVNDKYDLTI